MPPFLLGAAIMRYFLVLAFLLIATPAFAINVWTIDTNTYSTIINKNVFNAGLKSNITWQQANLVARRSAFAVISKSAMPIVIALTAKQIYDLVNADPNSSTNYPFLNAQINKDQTLPSVPTYDECSPDMVFTYNSNYYKVGSLYNSGSVSGVTVPSFEILATQNGVMTKFGVSKTVNGVVYYKHYYVGQTTKPPPKHLTQAEFDQALFPVGSSPDLPIGIGADLDKLAANNPDAVSTEPTIGEVVDSYSDYAKAAAAAAAAAAATQAASNTTSAQQAVNDATTRYQNNPNDANFASLQEAIRALQEAQLQQTQTQYQEASEAKEDIPMPSVTTPTIKTFNWSKWSQLKNIMATVFPFNLLNSAVSVAQNLVSSPVAPVFDLPLFGQTIHVDLSILDPVATALRWVIAFGLTIGIIFVVVRFYRGIGG